MTTIPYIENVAILAAFTHHAPRLPGYPEIHRKRGHLENPCGVNEIDLNCP